MAQQQPFNDPQHRRTDPHGFEPGPRVRLSAPAQPYGGPGYRQPAYYLPQPQRRALGIAALVAGLAGIVSLGFFVVPQLAAIVLGHLGLRREPAGRVMAAAGLTLGYLVAGIWTALHLLELVRP